DATRRQHEKAGRGGPGRAGGQGRAGPPRRACPPGLHPRAARRRRCAQCAVGAGRHRRTGAGRRRGVVGPGAHRCAPRPRGRPVGGRAGRRPRPVRLVRHAGAGPAVPGPVAAGPDSGAYGLGTRPRRRLPPGRRGGTPYPLGPHESALGRRQGGPFRPGGEGPGRGLPGGPARRGRHQDVSELARRAVAEGADLLAVAGGDGTQALVAEVAAYHDLPFVVIPAGTRNHFALDLGLDRDDPAAALEALTHGVELRVDLGYAADRVFVNNASFGTYASIVTDPAYRDAKARTALRTLPGLLTGEDAPGLRAQADGTRLDGLQALGLQALLVSNNPYGRAVDAARPGRRERLDSGLLGVVCVRVGNTAQAARIVGGPRSGGLVRLSAGEVVVESDTGTLPVGIDGEHVVLPSPVVCRSAPGALRVRVPRHRPHAPRVTGGAADWPRVARLALGRPSVPE
ncbi:LOW QUALITY PROTEIN: diacylglycerol kinase, partial [Streptomyces sviceus ATCC 29083]